MAVLRKKPRGGSYPVEAKGALPTRTQEHGMKFTIVAMIGLGFVAASAIAVGQDSPAGSTALKDVKAKASYGFGLSLGRNLKTQSIDVDPDLLVKGIKDALSGATPLLTDAQIQEALQALTQQAAAQKMESMKAVGAKNKTEGEAFLAANKKKPGVKALSSGLQYKVIKEGTGPTPKETDTVKTHYAGTLLDGTEFDSSIKRGEPAKFPVNGVIRGWTEALQKMKVGSKWQLFIPSELAYGPNGRSGIPPNAVLVFEIELLGIE
jgi:FKBP-type peptidyl-prolyl cis-trans isomerase FklB